VDEASFPHLGADSLICFITWLYRHRVFIKIRYCWYLYMRNMRPQAVQLADW